jgi:uncharacterized membrane protein
VVTPESTSRDKIWVLVRAAIALAAGAVAGVLIPGPAESTWWEHALIGWIVGAGVYVLSTWLVVFRMNSAQARDHAVTLAWPHHTIGAFVLAIAFFSLIAVGAILKAGAVSGHHSVYRAGIGLLGVAVSWFAVHTVFMLGYARHYFKYGGIEFEPEDEDRNYTDLAYVAFTIGMAYGVTDTRLTSRSLRRGVLLHALVSYAFGAVILAATVNLVVGLDFFKR